MGRKKIRISGSTGWENPVWNLWKCLLTTILNQFWWFFDILFIILRCWKATNRFFLYRFMQNRKIRFSVPVSATAVAMFTSIFLITNKRCCSNILVSLTSLLGTSIWFVCVLRETQFSRQWKTTCVETGAIYDLNFDLCIWLLFYEWKERRVH